MLRSARLDADPITSSGSGTGSSTAPATNFGSRRYDCWAKVDRIHPSSDFPDTGPMVSSSISVHSHTFCRSTAVISVSAQTELVRVNFYGSDDTLSIRANRVDWPQSRQRATATPHGSCAAGNRSYYRAISYHTAVTPTGTPGPLRTQVGGYVTCPHPR